MIKIIIYFYLFQGKQNIILCNFNGSNCSFSYVEHQIIIILTRTKRNDFQPVSIFQLQIILFLLYILYL